MVITNRDILLFKKLSSYGMLSTKQITHNIFQAIAKTTVLRRLRFLEQGHYLKRITGLETEGLLWILTDKGAETASVPLPKRNWSKNMLDHDYKLLCLRLSLEQSGVAKSWIPEHEIRSLIFKKYPIKEAKQKLIPDGLMGVDLNVKRSSVAIELELTLKNQSRINEIVKRYQEKKDLSAVYYFAASNLILKSVRKIWNSHQEFNSTIRLSCFLLDDVMKNPLIVQAKPAHSSALGVSTYRPNSLELIAASTQENHL